MIESLFNFIPGGSEWIIVIVAAGVLLFGAKKIPELAKTFGKAKGEYKKGEIEADKELKEFKESKDQDFSISEIILSYNLFKESLYGLFFEKRDDFTSNSAITLRVVFPSSELKISFMLLPLISPPTTRISCV